MDVTAFATACRNLGNSSHHAEAEAALISLRSSPHAVDTALEVLRTSGEELVTFHAALLLRDAALRQYQTAGMEAELAILQKSLDFALSRPVRGTGDALLQTYAAIFKRSFLDLKDDAKQKYIQQITVLLENSATEWHALRTLLHIIWEFGLTSQSTYLGQTLEFHGKCGKSFAQQFLKPLFIFVVNSLGRLQSSEALMTALDILDAVLSWPFEQYSTSSSSNYNSSATSFLYSVPADQRAGTLHLRNASRRICPKREWSFLVAGDDLTSALLNIYSKFEPASELRSKIRQVLICLACLSGDVFENEEIRVAHAKRMTVIGYSLCENAFRDQREFKRSVDLEEHESWVASECLGGCVIIARALTITPCELLLRDNALLPNLLALTLAISEACRLCTVRYETTFLGESLRALTSVWVLFSASVLNKSQQAESESNVQSVAPASHVEAEMRQCAYRIFESIVQTMWQTAPLSKDSTEEEEDDEGESEEMSDLASIARANLKPALSYLCELLRKFEETPHDTPETRAERLGFLMRLTADVLADVDEGEIPLIPRSILEYSAECSRSGEDDLVVSTSMLLWRVMERETGRLELVSPLLSENLLIAMRRWAASYLLPPASLYAEKKGGFRGLEALEARHQYAMGDDGGDYSTAYRSSSSLPQTLQASFADPNKGVPIMNFLIQSSCIHLAAYGGEETVGAAAVALLETCTKHKVHLKSSSGWQELCRAHVQSMGSATWEPLAQVGLAAHGELARVLSSGVTTPEEFDTLLAMPLQNRLGVLLSGSSMKNSPQWTSDAVRVCEIFRGMASSGFAGGDLSDRIRLRAIERLHELVSLAEARKDFEDNEAVLLAVLAGFADFCESQLSFTESARIPVVFNAAQRLVTHYAAVETKSKAARDAARAKGVAITAEELEYRSGGLNKVLRMLISLSERNTLDFSSDDIVPSGQEQDASGVVLICIDAVLPLFDADLFHVAEVVESYFDLVAGMCRTRPEHVSGLPYALFAAVVTSLSMGCEHHDPKIQRWCFESIGSLARLHADTHGASLNFQIQNNPNLLLDFTAKILELVVLSADMGALDAAAGALLNLARCSQQIFAQAVELTLAKAGTHRRDGLLIDPSAENARIQTLVQVLQAQFAKLFDGVRIQGADRMDRKRFASNLTSFAREVRAYVLVK